MNTLKIENAIKSRSILAITATSYRLMSQNITFWAKRLWAWLIGVSAIIGIACSAAFTLISTTDANTTFLLWCVWAAASLATLVLMACVSGSIMATLKEQKAKQNIKRAIKLSVLTSIVFIADVAVFYLISIPLVLVWHQGMLLLHVFISLVIVLITALLLIPAGYSGMKYMAEDNLGILSVMGHNYLVGLRYYGRLFLTFFVTMLIGALLAMLLASPLWVIAVASLQDALGIYLGDASGMPTTAPILIFLGAFVAAMACSPIWLWQFFCLYYQYGSITARIKEKDKVMIQEE